MTSNSLQITKRASRAPFSLDQALSAFALGISAPSLLALAAAIWAAPELAGACGTCVTAQVDQKFPLLIYFSYIGAGWFLALALLGRRSPRALFAMPTLFMACLLLIAGVVLGLAVLGPLLLAAAAAWAVIGYALSFMRWGREDRRIAILTHAISLAAIAMILGFGLKANEARPMKDVDFIIKWAETGPARMTANALMKKGAPALPEIRRLVREGRSQEVCVATEYLAKIGDAAQDAPLLIQTIERARSNKDMNWIAGEVEEDLNKLSGLNLPKGTPVEKWRAAWKEKTKAQAL